MTGALPHQLVWQARQIAEAHSLRVATVADPKLDRKTGDRTLVTAYVVYRLNARNDRGARLCKTRSPERLLARVRTAAGLSQ